MIARLFSVETALRHFYDRAATTFMYPLLLLRWSLCRAFSLLATGPGAIGWQVLAFLR
jgi:hypothetical protein